MVGGVRFPPLPVEVGKRRGEIGDFFHRLVQFYKTIKLDCIGKHTHHIQRLTVIEKNQLIGLDIRMKANISKQDKDQIFDNLFHI